MWNTDMSEIIRLLPKYALLLQGPSTPPSSINGLLMSLSVFSSKYTQAVSAAKL